MSLFSELKRRQVFRVGAAYLLAAWLVIRLAAIEMAFLQHPPGHVGGM